MLMLCFFPKGGNIASGNLFHPTCWLAQNIWVWVPIAQNWNLCHQFFTNVHDHDDSLSESALAAPDSLLWWKSGVSLWKRATSSSRSNWSIDCHNSNRVRTCGSRLFRCHLWSCCCICREDWYSTVWSPNFGKKVWKN